MPNLEFKIRQGNKKFELDGPTITIGRLPGGVLQKISPPDLRCAGLCRRLTDDEFRCDFS